MLRLERTKHNMFILWHLQCIWCRNNHDLLFLNMEENTVINEQITSLTHYSISCLALNFLIKFSLDFITHLVRFDMHMTQTYLQPILCIEI